MAVREGDTALWLHNKLGSTDDLWSGSSICSQLTREKLLSIHDCFHNLQPYVKVKLMLSFLHLPKRNIEEWQHNLDEILLLAQEDTDQWVAMIGDILKTYPSMGTLNSEVDDSGRCFHEIQAILKKMVKKSEDSHMLPMECLYLSKMSMTAVAGQQPQPVKHFALKLKPKSAALRADLLQKSIEAAGNIRRTSSATSVPIKVRSFAKTFTDKTPMRGLPSRPDEARHKLGRFSSTPLAGKVNQNHRREGGVKFLEITEQPVGVREAKRRRKMADDETKEQNKKEQSSATPDYATGLSNALSENTSTIIGGDGNHELSYLAPETSTIISVPKPSTTQTPTTTIINISKTMSSLVGKRTVLSTNPAIPSMGRPTITTLSTTNLTPSLPNTNTTMQSTSLTIGSLNATSTGSIMLQQPASVMTSVPIANKALSQQFVPAKTIQNEPRQNIQSVQQQTMQLQPGLQSTSVIQPRLQSPSGQVTQPRLQSTGQLIQPGLHSPAGVVQPGLQSPPVQVQQQIQQPVVRIQQGLQSPAGSIQIQNQSQALQQLQQIQLQQQNIMQSPPVGSQPSQQLSLQSHLQPHIVSQPQQLVSQSQPVSNQLTGAQSQVIGSQQQQTFIPQAQLVSSQAQSLGAQTLAGQIRTIGGQVRTQQILGSQNVANQPQNLTAQQQAIGTQAQNLRAHAPTQPLVIRTQQQLQAELQRRKDLVKLQQQRQQQQQQQQTQQGGIQQLQQNMMQAQQQPNRLQSQPINLQAQRQQQQSVLQTQPINLQSQQQQNVSQTQPINLQAQQQTRLQTQPINLQTQQQQLPNVLQTQPMNLQANQQQQQVTLQSQQQQYHTQLQQQQQQPVLQQSPPTGTQTLQQIQQLQGLRQLQQAGIQVQQSGVSQGVPGQQLRTSQPMQVQQQVQQLPQQVMRQQPGITDQQMQGSTMQSQQVQMGMQQSAGLGAPQQSASMVGTQQPAALGGAQGAQQHQVPHLASQGNRQPGEGKPLKLSTSEMEFAKELFQMSNKLSKIDKVNVLGFIGGSRDNPYPNLGDVINIHLSENKKSLQQPDGTFQPMWVDTFFQMDFKTGKWQQLQKLRAINQ